MLCFTTPRYTQLCIHSWAQTVLLLTPRRPPRVRVDSWEPLDREGGAVLAENTSQAPFTCRSGPVVWATGRPAGRRCPHGDPLWRCPERPWACLLGERQQQQDRQQKLRDAGQPCLLGPQLVKHHHTSEGRAPRCRWRVATSPLATRPEGAAVLSPAAAPARGEMRRPSPPPGTTAPTPASLARSGMDASGTRPPLQAPLWTQAGSGGGAEPGRLRDLPPLP